jgi:hypothetical protein
VELIPKHHKEAFSTYSCSMPFYMKAPFPGRKGRQTFIIENNGLTVRHRGGTIINVVAQE